MTVWTKESIQALLETNDLAVAKAIIALYKRQTDAEKSGEHTNVSNGVGFNQVDAPFLTSIAKALPKYNMHMTPKQLARARKSVMKYHRQLTEIANENEMAKVGLKPIDELSTPAPVKRRLPYANMF